MFKMVDEEVINFRQNYSIQDLEGMGYDLDFDAEEVAKTIGRPIGPDGVLYRRGDDTYVFNKMDDGHLRAIAYMNRATGNWRSI